MVDELLLEELLEMIRLLLELEEELEVITDVLILLLLEELVELDEELELITLLDASLLTNEEPMEDTTLLLEEELLVEVCPEGLER